jgi:hypothetical protein
MTDSANVEIPVATELTMSVVGYTLSSDRSLVFVEHFENPPELVVQSSAKLNLDVQGATVEHHDNRQITFAVVNFTEGPFDSDRVGFLNEAGTVIGIIVNVPKDHFPAFWAALLLEREATLVCSIAVGTNGVGTDRVLGLKVRGRRS